MRDLLLPYLGTRTEHFQHEFYNFARSPYDLVGFDRNAAYEARCDPEPGPTFIVDGRIRPKYYFYFFHKTISTGTSRSFALESNFPCFDIL
jgi:hypothetical protein